MVDFAVISVLERLGFADILLWLLTFAIVYGILSQINIPKNSRETQAIIAVVVGFLVLLSTPAALISFISNVSSSLILVGVGLLMIIIFLEVAGLSKEVVTKIDEKGNAVTEKVSFLSNHPVLFTLILLIIVAVIFVSSGGLSIVGFDLPRGFDVTGTIFIIAIVAAIGWMIFGETKKKK